MDYDKIMREIDEEIAKLNYAARELHDVAASLEALGLERAKHIVVMAKLTHGQGK